MTENETSECRVVVVDDNQDAADMMAAALELEGYAARTASDGAQALETIEQFHPLVVVLDVDMPRMDGSELTLKLRERYGDSIILIAVAGGRPKDDARVATTFDLVDHYFSKPVDLKELCKVLRLT